jgi:hypothetical protein
MPLTYFIIKLGVGNINFANVYENLTTKSVFNNQLSLSKHALDIVKDIRIYWLGTILQNYNKIFLNLNNILKKLDMNII